MNDTPRCVHMPPFAGMIETPDETRKDWIKSTCPRCGRVVGYRPVESQKPTRRAPARQTNQQEV